MPRESSPGLVDAAGRHSSLPRGGQQVDHAHAHAHAHAQRQNVLAASREAGEHNDEEHKGFDNDERVKERSCWRGEGGEENKGRQPRPCTQVKVSTLYSNLDDDSKNDDILYNDFFGNDFQRPEYDFHEGNFSYDDLKRPRAPDDDLHDDIFHHDDDLDLQRPLAWLSSPIVRLL